MQSGSRSNQWFIPCQHLDKLQMLVAQNHYFGFVPAQNQNNGLFWFSTCTKPLFWFKPKPEGYGFKNCFLAFLPLNFIVQILPIYRELCAELNQLTVFS